MVQYQSTVKPMHSTFVEPSKMKADVIVNSETGSSVDIAIEMLANHLLLKSGILPGATTEDGSPIGSSS